jgi:hypothetical protein
MPDPRPVSSCLLAIALALAACAPPSTAGQPPDGAGGQGDGQSGDGSLAADARTPPVDGRARPDAAGDAALPPIDASGMPVSDASIVRDASEPDGGTVACYTTGNPGASCTLPVHCCFTNYDSSHDGACSSAACTWGTIDCDGPEDCASGQHCCATVIADQDTGIMGYTLACQSAACGAAPTHQELCHPTSSPGGTCSGSGRSCVPALGHDNDLPRSLSICQ